MGSPSIGNRFKTWLGRGGSSGELAERLLLGPHVSSGEGQLPRVSPGVFRHDSPGTPPKVSHLAKAGVARHSSSLLPDSPRPIDRKALEALDRFLSQTLRCTEASNELYIDARRASEDSFGEVCRADVAEGMRAAARRALELKGDRVMYVLLSSASDPGGKCRLDDADLYPSR